MSSRVRRRTRVVSAAHACALTVVLVVSVASVRADPLGEITAFSDGITPASLPHSITTGPDGNLWFTEFFGNNLARITTDGVVTEFPLPTADAQPRSITTGPDGNLWFVQDNANSVAVADINGNVLDEFDVAAGPPACAICGPFDITVGPDGNLWVLEGDALKVARLTPAGGFTEYPLTASAPGALWMAVGPDKNLWVSYAAASVLSRVTLAGEVTDFPFSTFTQSPGVTAGPDCNVWYTASAAGSDVVAIQRVGTGVDLVDGVCGGIASTPEPVVLTPTFTG